jgi:outer membrane protein assembly factor BamB
MPTTTSRPRRYLLIAGLLLLAGVIGLSWSNFRRFFPNAFDRKTTDPVELERLNSANLSPTSEPHPDIQKSDWPQFLGPTRNGWALSANFRTNWREQPPKRLWSTPCRGGYSSLGLANGRLYTQDRVGNDERLLCLNAETGAILWSHQSSADYSGFKQGYMSGPRATPTIFDGRIYTVGATGKLLCLQELKGTETQPRVLWELDFMKEFGGAMPEWGVACSPLIEGDWVIVQPGGRNASVVALDRKTGEKRWSVGGDPSGYSSPVAATLGGVRQIVAVTGKSVLGIRASDGVELWRYPWATKFNGNIASPVILGDYVFVSSGYNKGCALLHIIAEGANRANGKPVYFLPNELMRNHHSTSIHKDGFLYGFDDNTLRCINVREQREMDDWPTKESNGLSKGTVLLVGENLLGLTQNGTLFLAAADPQEFRLLGLVENALAESECWAAPAVTPGRIYLRSKSSIVCYDVTATDPTR